MVDIQELKRRHHNIKQTICESLQRGQYPEYKLMEYHKLVKLLEEAGEVVNDKRPLLLKALEMEAQQPQHESNTPSQDSVYRITIAWTSRTTHEPDNTIHIIEDYLLQNKATPKDKEDVDFDDYTEHMRIYEWQGGDKEFTILRRSANYILDTFAENSYEKFNISVFGSKKM